nr:MAG TPA: hypothetical protein [Caudoviricetes sp.]
MVMVLILPLTNIKLNKCETPHHKVNIVLY